MERREAARVQQICFTALFAGSFLVSWCQLSHGEMLRVAFPSRYDWTLENEWESPL
jgi:hypothetical protein